MGETILTVGMLLLALSGCAQGIRWLGGRLWGGGARQAVLLLPLSGHCEDAEYRIRGCLRAAAETRLPVWVVDAGLDPPSRELVQEVCGRMEGVRFLPSEKILENFEITP